jgi:hypothetical protein
MKTIRIKNLMAALFAVTLSIITLSITSPPASAQNWARAYGQGNNNGTDNRFTGAGIPLAVVQSVQSNSFYFITSPKAAGSPTIDGVIFKTDTLAGTVRYYVATNSWLIASNSPNISGASSNILWLQSTNAGLSTNDILVHQDVLNDTLQMTILSGNATDSAGLVYTNALGECAIKIFNTITNLPLRGDKIWKMTLVESWTPLGIASLTNSAIYVTNISPVTPFWPLALSATGPYIRFSGPQSVPTMLVLTCSNTASLHVEGNYGIIPRR